MFSKSHNHFKSIFVVLFTVLISLTSCDSFLNTVDVKNRIESEIAHANAPPYSVRVQINQEGSGSILTPSGDKEIKVNDWFDIAFRVNNSWTFFKWEAVKKSDPSVLMSDYVEFKEITELETEARLIKDSDDILIRPVCEQKFYLTEISPSSGDIVNRDSSISIKFNQNVSTECDLSGIGISIQGLADGKSYFKDPEIIGGNTIVYFADSQNLIPVSGTDTLVVSVSVPGSIFYSTENGDIYLDSAFNSSYFVTSATNKKTSISFKLNDTQSDSGVLKVNGVTNNEEQKEYSIGEKVTLQFNKSDNYYFEGWEVKIPNPDYVEGSETQPAELDVSNSEIIIEYPEGTESELGFDSAKNNYSATAVILSSVSNVIIRPVCRIIPTAKITFELNNQNSGVLKVNNKSVQSDEEEEFKEGTQLTLQFSKDDAYNFNGWNIYVPNENFNALLPESETNKKGLPVDSEKIVVSYPEGTDENNFGFDSSKKLYRVNVSIVSAVESFVIEPKCSVIPTVNIYISPEDSAYGTLKVNDQKYSEFQKLYSKNSEITVSFTINNYYWAGWYFSNNELVEYSFPENEENNGYDEKTKTAKINIKVVGKEGEVDSKISIVPKVTTIPSTSLTIMQDPIEETLPGILKVDDVSVSSETNGNSKSYQENDEIKIVFKKYSDYEWSSFGSRWVIGNKKIITVVSEENDSDDTSTLKIKINKKTDDNSQGYSATFIKPAVKKIPKVKIQFNLDSEDSGVIRINDRKQDSGYELTLKRDQEFTVSFTKDSAYEWTNDSSYFEVLNTNDNIELTGAVDIDAAKTTAILSYKVTDGYIQSSELENKIIKIKPLVKKTPVVSVRFESGASGTLRVNDVLNTGDVYNFKRGQEFTVTFKVDGEYCVDTDHIWDISDESGLQKISSDSEDYDADTKTAYLKYRVISNTDISNIVIKPKASLREKINIEFSGSHGKMTPAKGSYEKYIGSSDGDNIQLYFEEDKEYAFIEWKITDNKGNILPASCYEITANQKDKVGNLKNPDISIKFIQKPENAAENFSIKVNAVTSVKPEIVYATPTYSSSGSFAASRIMVMFDHDMDSNSLYYSENEIAELKQNGVKKSDLKYDSENRCYAYNAKDGIHYRNISITNLVTGKNISDNYLAPVFESPNSLVIKANPENLPNAGTQVYVTVSTDYFYKENDIPVTLVSSKKWNFLINGNSDSNAPTPAIYIYTSESNSSDVSNKLVENLDITLAKDGITSDEDPISYFKDYKLENNILRLYLSSTDIDGSGNTDTFKLEMERIYDSEFNKITVPETPVSRTIYYGSSNVSYGTSAVSSYGNAETEPGTFDLNGISNGVYKLKLTIADNADNSASSGYYYVLVDSEAPQANYSFYSYMNDNSPAIDVLINPFGDVDFKSYQVICKNKNGEDVKVFDESNENPAAPVTLTINSGLVKDSLYDIHVITKDKLDNIRDDVVEYPTIPGPVTNLSAVSSDSEKSISFNWEKPSLYSGVVYTIVDSDSNILANGKIEDSENTCTATVSNSLFEYSSDYIVKVVPYFELDGDHVYSYYYSDLNTETSVKTICPPLSSDLIYAVSYGSASGNTADDKLNIRFLYATENYGGSRIYFTKDTGSNSDFDISGAVKFSDTQKDYTSGVYYYDVEKTAGFYYEAIIKYLPLNAKYNFKAFNYEKFENGACAGRRNENVYKFSHHTAPFPVERAGSLFTSASKGNYDTSARLGLNRWLYPGETKTDGSVVSGELGNIVGVRIYYMSKDSPITENDLSSCEYVNVYKNSSGELQNSGYTSYLPAGYKYYVAYKAIDDEGNLSCLSGNDCQYIYPDIVTNVTPTSDKSSIKLTWTKSKSKVNKYVVVWSDSKEIVDDSSSDNSLRLLNFSEELDYTTNSYTISGLQAGTKYYYKVIAAVDCDESTVNIDGTSYTVKKYNGSSTATAGVYTLPALPSNITKSASNTSITLSWENSNENVSGAYISYGYSESALTNYVYAEGTEKEINGLSQGRKVYFSIQSYIKDESKYYLSSDSTSITKNTMPLQVTRTSVMPSYSYGDITERFSWPSSKDTLIKVRVYYKAGNSSEFALSEADGYMDFEKTSSDVYPTTGILSGLLPGYKYYTRFTAIDDEGNESSPCSGDYTYLLPVAVTGLTKTKNTDDSFTLKWNTAEHTKYMVYYSTSNTELTSSNESTFTKSALLTTNSYTTPVLSDQYYYYFTVVSYPDTDLTMSLNNLKKATVNTESIIPIKDFTSTYLSSSSVTVSWLNPADISNINKVRVFYSRVIDNYYQSIDILKEDNTLVDSKEISGLRRGYRYKFFVRYYDADGNFIAGSKTISIDLSPVAPTLSFVPQGTKKVKIKLSGGSGRYRLYYGTSVTNINTEMTSSLLPYGTTEYDFEFPSLATNYYVKALARPIDDYGTRGIYSSNISIRTGESVYAKMGSKWTAESATTVSLDWTAPSTTTNIRGYRLLFKRIDSGLCSSISASNSDFSIDSSGNFYCSSANCFITEEITGLTRRQDMSGTKAGYGWTVYPVIINKSGMPSVINSSSSATFCAAPDVPTLSSVSYSSNTYTIKWAANGYADKIRIYYIGEKSKSNEDCKALLLSNSSKNLPQTYSTPGTSLEYDKVFYIDVDASKGSTTLELDSSRYWQFNISALSIFNSRGGYTESNGLAATNIIRK